MFIICPKGLNIGQDTEKHYPGHLSKTFCLAYKEKNLCVQVIGDCYKAVLRINAKH